MPDTNPIKPKATKSTTAIDNTGLKNTEISVGISKSISSSNYVWARPAPSYQGNSRVPYVGAVVYVYFEDGDPNKVYYRPYSPSLNGDSVAMDTIGATSDQFNPDNKPNLHVIEVFADGTTVFYNENGATRQYGFKMADGTCFTVDNSGTKQQILLHTSNNNNILIDQTNKNITIITEKLHKFILDDKNQNISINTTGKHWFTMDDKNQNITVTTTGKHNLTMDDKGKKLSLTSTNGNAVDLDDNSNTVTLKNNGGASVTMKNGSVTMVNGSGASVGLSGGNIMLN